MAVGLTTNLRHNTWTVGQWYDQTVADDSNVIDYEGERSMFGWGESASNKYAFWGPGSESDKSSPVQTPGSIWKFVARAYADQNGTYMALKSNGNLYTWGGNNQGNLGQNQGSGGAGSSPRQIPGEWSDACAVGKNNNYAVKTNGKLFTWGNHNYGELGQNNLTKYSSPAQVGSDTNWTTTRRGISAGGYITSVIKTDGTLWTWGQNTYGDLGLNNRTNYSSPVQIPGSTWSKISAGEDDMASIKTDGTLWVWGRNNAGQSGVNDKTARSSPTQVPGTTWRSVDVSRRFMIATKTDGTLWTWGLNESGQLGQNETDDAYYSSPVQVPGTTWAEEISCAEYTSIATKTDGTLWAWGANGDGGLGQNNTTSYSSPVQIGSGLTGWKYVSLYHLTSWATTNT